MHIVATWPRRRVTHLPPGSSSPRSETDFPSACFVSISYRGLMVTGMIIVDNPGSDEHAYWPIVHAEWNGWTPADFIFPSFLFLVGISLVYSFDARRQRGQTKRQILWNVFQRTLILIAI